MFFWQCSASAVTMHPASCSAREQFGHDGDFVALAADLALAQQQSAFGGPGVDDDARILPLLQRAAQGLAVQRHHLTSEHAACAVRPARQAAAKLLRVQRLEDAVVGVVRGRAVAQDQKGLQPVQPDLAELFHVVEALAAAQDGAQRDGEDVRQGVIDRGGDARIGHFLQDGEQTGELGFRDVDAGGWCGLQMLLHPSHLYTLFKSTRTKWHTLIFLLVCVSPVVFGVRSGGKGEQ